MQDTYQNIIEKIEYAFQYNDRGNKRVGMIKDLRGAFNISLSEAKNLADWYTGYRYNNMYPFEYNPNVAEIIRTHSGYNILSFNEPSPTLGDILKDALKEKSKGFVLVIDGHLYEAETIAESDRVRDLAKKLSKKVRVFQEI